MNTLVIGGGGYIGMHLVPALFNAGRNVTVLDREAGPQHRFPEEIRYIVGDFGQLDLIRGLLDHHQEVIDLAYASVPYTSFENPFEDLLQNLPPAVQLFSEIAARGGKLVMISSGGTVYGEATTLPIREDHPTRPISPYGVTKLTLENYAHLYAVTHDLRFICIRPSNAFGAGQRPFEGQGFIATAMASAMRGQPIRIFGQRGTTRDYIYVSDLAAGIVGALEKGHISTTYNLGSGVGLSNIDVIKAMIPIMEETGHEVRIEHLPDRIFDVKVNILDSTKLKDHTGWKPEVTFHEGLLRTRAWLKDHYG
jgi:UDP-glucose 4-epimerase